MSGFLPLGTSKAAGVWNRCGSRRRPRRWNYCRCWYHCGHVRNLRTDTTINGPTVYCVHAGQWSRIRSVHANVTTKTSMLNYLLCKSSLASEIAVRDHMCNNGIYLFWYSLPPVLIWTNSFGTLCIYIYIYIYIYTQWVYCKTWPAVAHAGEVTTYSRRIAYIPANSNHINNFF